jgi:LmbE family N-acetylglucosaminyl deacetylase
MTQPKLRFLGIVAHPHDFTHFAGTLGVHTSLGDSATVVAMTAGVGTHNERLDAELKKPKSEQDPAIVDQSPEERAAEKEDELRRACAFFGVTDVRVLGFPDKPFVFERNPDSAERLRDVILEVRPHVIFSQSPYLKGPHGHKSGAPNDHTEAAYATAMAKQLSGLPRLSSGQAPHTVAATYFPGVYFAREEWDFVVDITDWYEQRVQAEATYVSQGHTPEFARRRITIGAGSIGWSAGTQYAEAFVREAPESLTRITLPESLLKVETQSSLDRLAAITGGDEEDASADEG